MKTTTHPTKTRTRAQIKSGKIAINRLIQPFDEVMAHIDSVGGVS